MLLSGRMEDKAWGAFWAGKLQSDDLRGPLLEQFRAAAAFAAAPSWGAEHGFVLALFDAAIEMRLAVPAQLLEPFEDLWSQPVLIVLARTQDGEGPLLRLAGNSRPDLVWLAANNLLAERKSQTWYGRLLADVSITHLFVVTGEEYGPGFGGGVGGGVCGDGVLAMGKGFPPVALYTLVEDEPGSVLLARGPQNVYYRRTVIPTDQQVGFGSCWPALDRAVIRLGYLTRLASSPPLDAARIFRASTEIRFRTPEQFREEVEQALTTQEQAVRSLLDAIRQQGFDYPSGLHLRIASEIRDVRQGAHDPLPPVPAREIVFNE